MQSEPNIVDWLTLVAATLGAVLGAGTTVWAIMRGERNKFTIHIDWEWFGYEAAEPEVPFLYVQNLTSRPLIISEIAFYRGLFYRRLATRVALQWEDPSDLKFPYSIEPNAMRKFVVSEIAATLHFEHISKFSICWDGLAALTFGLE